MWAKGSQVDSSAFPAELCVHEDVNMVMMRAFLVRPVDDPDEQLGAVTYTNVFCGSTEIRISRTLRHLKGSIAETALECKELLCVDVKTSG